MSSKKDVHLTYIGGGKKPFGVSVGGLSVRFDPSAGKPLTLPQKEGTYLAAVAPDVWKLAPAREQVEVVAKRSGGDDGTQTLPDRGASEEASSEGQSDQGSGKRQRVGSGKSDRKEAL